MDFQAIEVTGQVIHEVVNRGSKSEHDAVVLKTPDGQTYVLRRQSGPAFADPELEALVGKSFLIDGMAAGNTLMMQKWTPVD